MEALVCHPLGTVNSVVDVDKRHQVAHGLRRRIDTIKVRMQLSRRARQPGVRSHKQLVCAFAKHNKLMTQYRPRNGASYEREQKLSRERHH